MRRQRACGRGGCGPPPAWKKPLICAVNGLAVGAGMDMALLCDIRLAAESAQFGTGDVRIVLDPGAAGASLLPRLVGTARALELFWTGELLSAQQAREMGIVSHVFADDELLGQALGFAGRIDRQ